MDVLITLIELWCDQNELILEEITEVEKCLQ